jgi:putative transcriptional regulator
MIQGLRELHEALRSGEPIESKFTVRKIALDLAPQSYDAEQVRQTRAMLNVSQEVFAQLLAVSVGLVRAWERGDRTPAGPVRRLLDDMREQPKRWQRRLRKAARSA